MKTVLTATAGASLTFTLNRMARADDSDEVEGPQSAWRRESRLREAQHKRAHQTQRQTRHEREERLRELGRNRFDRG
ncbi:MAG: hypothetical protein IPI57_06480 [Candidatus Competibacteraceae bacterium]|nr:hypothetical protein [Candidatus Competibacteraceae bacterium]MBK7984529.1 hypothetical protein [Candidatus Competibacteraceae bacterium]